MIIDHVGIATDSLEEAIALYERTAGLSIVHRETVATEHVRVAFLAPADAGVEAAAVELLEPTSNEGAIAAFLSKRVPGMHHIAFHADSVGAEMERLREAGLPPLEQAPRPERAGITSAFCILGTAKAR